MPARNRIKTYVPETYYHLYNRGVEKRGIFLDAQDYAVWHSYLRVYLLPKNITELNAILTSETTTTIEKDKARKILRLNNFAETIRLHAYSFMPNHFHFLLWQSQAENIDQFMNSFGTRYTMYFNKKYKRVGPLFQGVYKAVRVESDEQLLYLTKYIHRNPFIGYNNRIDMYQHSSCSQYYKGVGEAWIDVNTIRLMWNLTPARYKSFVEESTDDEKMAILLKDIIVDY